MKNRRQNKIPGITNTAGDFPTRNFADKRKIFMSNAHEFLHGRIAACRAEEDTG
jgi:hypothetical protein